MSDGVRPNYGPSQTVLYNLGMGDLNIPEMGMIIQMERHSILQSQVKSQFDDMQKRNNWLKEAGQMLQDLRNRKPDSDTKKDGYIPQGTVDFLQKNGITVPGECQLKDGRGNGTAAQFTTMIETLKNTIDQVNTSSQLDMVRLQGLMDKLNQATDFMTNWCAKNSKSMDSIIGNIR